MIVDLVLYLNYLFTTYHACENTYVASLQIVSIQIRLIALVSTFLKSVHYR